MYNTSKEIISAVKQIKFLNRPELLSFYFGRVLYVAHLHTNIKDDRFFPFPLVTKNYEQKYYLHSIILHSGNNDVGNYCNLIFDNEKKKFIELYDINIVECSIFDALTCSYGGESSITQAVMIHNAKSGDLQTIRYLENYQNDYIYDSKQKSKIIVINIDKEEQVEKFKKIQASSSLKDIKVSK